MKLDALKYQKAALKLCMQGFGSRGGYRDGFCEAARSFPDVQQSQGWLAPARTCCWTKLCPETTETTALG